MPTRKLEEIEKGEGDVSERSSGKQGGGGGGGEVCQPENLGEGERDVSVNSAKRNSEEQGEGESNHLEIKIDHGHNCRGLTPF